MTVNQFQGPSDPQAFTDYVTKQDWEKHKDLYERPESQLRGEEKDVWKHLVSPTMGLGMISYYDQFAKPPTGLKGLSEKEALAKSPKVQLRGAAPIVAGMAAMQYSEHVASDPNAPANLPPGVPESFRRLQPGFTAPIGHSQARPRGWWEDMPRVSQDDDIYLKNPILDKFKDEFKGEELDTLVEREMQLANTTPFDLEAVANALPYTHDMAGQFAYTVGFENDTEAGRNPSDGLWYRYVDSDGVPNVGPGLNISDGNLDIMRLALSEGAVAGVDPENYEEWLRSVQSGQQGMTQEQVVGLFGHIMNQKVEIAKQVYPDFESMPPILKYALADGVYWSMFTEKHSSKTLQLIRDRKWKEAAAEAIRGHSGADDLEGGNIYNYDYARNRNRRRFHSLQDVLLEMNEVDSYRELNPIDDPIQPPEEEL